MMVTKIQKWGNSRAVRIPKAIADEAGLDIGHAVDMDLVDGEIRIKRARKRKRYNLDEMLASVPDDFEPEEWDTGPPVGNEVW
ncbi:MAG: AbrB/MazE/SpoVT family DNA-binding domain-containing protein [Chloroflexota bacterium]|nr:AbrB/MazE/SpoVT family DNA-binding domain-containing protein [Chloroflexota bacterium]MDE2908722.1 AbrB/MazE/SpoVT family DNA-binding domain-containing protein [Chloroflexota bacterium]